MVDFTTLEAWFVTGSQGLYGPETLEQVATDSQALVKGLNDSAGLPVKVVFKPVLTTPEGITRLCAEANAAPQCIGLVAWMHTFSPAKMWINGLAALRKPLVHLHTQFHRDLPWASIDMDFMNLHQSAHGGREFGFILSRLRKNRKVIVGHWQETPVQAQLATWMRAAGAWLDQQGLRVARFGDNMREVAVTEGDKVAAQIRLGYDVYGYGIGDLADRLGDISDADVDRLVGEYEQLYRLAGPLAKGGERRGELREAARIELALRAFLTEGGFGAFTTTFEDLHGIAQLPGLACQRLMADGYGFGAEGDWKTAALVRAFKVMGTGLAGGASFMEDYTYHLDPANPMVLGAHMLEVCPTIAGDEKASLEIHPLSIGGKADPCRLVFNAAAGRAVNVTLVDMGNRFRMIANEVDAVPPPAELPNLPVARAVWQPRPSLATSAQAWILAGGAHHFAYTRAVGLDAIEDFAELADVELVIIDADTRIRQLKQDLRTNEVYYATRGLA